MKENGFPVKLNTINQTGGSPLPPAGTDPGGNSGGGEKADAGTDSSRETRRPTGFRISQLLLVVILLLLFAAGGLWVSVKIPVPLFYWDYSPLILDEEGEIIRVFLNSREQWIFPPAETTLPAKLAAAVINYEDKRFYKHPGVDPLGLARAVYQNISSRRVVSGASTITMQLARLSRPKERTVRNKILEMIQALKIETLYNKDEILKLYLTHAPYGSNIIGYRTASYRYFGKSPSELTWGESATLAVLPNSPGLVNPETDSRKLKEKRDKLLARLLERGFIGKESYLLALEEAVPVEQLPFNLAAPHLTETIKYTSDSFIIRTTISSRIQSRVKEIVRDYMKEVSPRGIKNCSLLVAETKSGAVRAYIGSQDYFDNQNEGKINGVLTARSTGSILKPFLFGLAMDRGLIIPESRIEDIPVNYGAYTPYNYDGSFRGLVTAREALVNSLNAPAVALLSQYGIGEFYGFLQEAGITTLERAPEEYGLPLILGGAEASLWEIVSLYRGLGSGGRFAELRVLSPEEGGGVRPSGAAEIVEGKRGEEKNGEEKVVNKVEGEGEREGEEGERERINSGEGEGVQLFTAGSAYLVLDILKELTRPGVEAPWREYASSSQIAWKTGTSYGNRDAWAVGVTPELTIGVWLGNFDSSASKGLSGLEAAAPLLFRVFADLRNEYRLSWFEKPTDLREIQVSAETGYPLKEGMLRDAAVSPEKITVERPATAEPLRYSPYERALYVNQAGTEEVCSLCWERGDIKKVVQAVYPPPVAAFLKRMGNQVYTIPPHREDCPGISSQNPIEFVYPREGSVIEIPRGLSGEYQQITIRAAHSRGESRLFWYLDDSYIGETAEIHQLSLDFQNGWHSLQVIDENGHYLEVGFYTEKRKD